MRKLYLSVLGMYIGILCVFSQSTQQDSTAYKRRKLKLHEVNFVSGYYHQNGNNSAVTGGIGTEDLTDFSNTIELKFSMYDSRLRKHNLDFELGIDHYSSASSDKIDPSTISSASMRDNRYYPSVAWSIQNEQKGTTLGFNLSFSTEYDYTSFGFGSSFAKASKDRNREFTVKLQAYLDKWWVIYPIELRSILPEGIDDRRNSFSAFLTYSQVINQKLQILFVAEPTYQSGLLGTKYQRVYFSDGGENAETLPDQRLKIPVGIRANYFEGDRFLARLLYRYYSDNWGLKAHTLEAETPIKITPFISLSPFYRFYAQTNADYFAPYAQHNPSATYFTSDYDLSKFTSHYIGSNFRVTPVKGVFGIRKLNNLELRYGHYLRSNGLHSDQVSLHLQFK